MLYGLLFASSTQIIWFLALIRILQCSPVIAPDVQTSVSTKLSSAPKLMSFFVFELCGPS
jgi:hypothetical protein